MRAKALSIAVAALALAVLPAAGQTAKGKQTVKPAPQSGKREIINLRARVEYLDSGRVEMVDIKPSEGVPLRAGETVRIHLLGTGLVRGEGVEVPVNARWEEAAGRNAIEILRTGPNWVTVRATGQGTDNDLAQIEFRATGNYDMRPGFREGRITFELTGSRGTLPGQAGRRQRSEELTRLLYRTLLEEDLRTGQAQDDVETIFRRGYEGVREVALDLAREAEERRIFAREDDVEVVADLYRELLGRRMTDRELLREDEGFRDAVDEYRREGLTEIVEIIVGSPEFRSAHPLDTYRPGF